MHWAGPIPGHYALVLDLMGPNLEFILSQCKGIFSYYTVALLGIHMIDLVRHLHSCDFIHRDIKPENFVIGKDSPSEINLLDFGLAKRFRSKSSTYSMSLCETKGLIGTLRYASVNCHLAIDQSRRDDLESLIYVLIYFMRGKLPWQGMTAVNTQQQIERVAECKSSLPISILCHGLPSTNLFLIISYRTVCTDAVLYERSKMRAKT